MPRFAIGVLEDVTERKRAREVIDRLNEELEQRVAQRTAELENANRKLHKKNLELNRAKEARKKLLIQLRATNEQLIKAGLREKELAEEARLASKMLRMVIDTVPVGVVVSDTNGTIIISNPAISKSIGGMIAGDAYGAAFGFTLHHPDGSIFKPQDLPLSRALKGENVRDIEILARRDDCSETVLLVAASPIIDGIDAIVGAVATWQDITERKKAEDHHRRTLEQLHRAHRLETAGRIAGQVAHDFNNLLSPLVTYTELIRSQLSAGNSAYGYCDNMLEIAQEMVDINNNLLALGRRDDYTPQPVDLNRVVNQAIGQMSGRFDDVTMVADLAPDLPYVNGSSSQLRRVVTNMITNSCEAMKGAGLLTIRTERVRFDFPVNMYNRIEAGEYVKLTLSDNGCGIPANIRDKIFDAFFSTKSDNERLGMGLGLSVVQAIVEDHRGYIDLVSEVGKGTSFIIFLPVHSPPSGERG